MPFVLLNYISDCRTGTAVLARTMPHVLFPQVRRSRPSAGTTIAVARSALWRSPALEIARRELKSADCAKVADERRLFDPERRMPRHHEARDLSRPV